MRNTNTDFLTSSNWLLQLMPSDLHWHTQDIRSWTIRISKDHVMCVEELNNRRESNHKSKERQTGQFVGIKTTDLMFLTMATLVSKGFQALYGLLWNARFGRPGLKSSLGHKTHGKGMAIANHS